MGSHISARTQRHKEKTNMAKRQQVSMQDNYWQSRMKEQVLLFAMKRNSEKSSRGSDIWSMHAKCAASRHRAEAAARAKHCQQTTPARAQD